MTTYLLRWDPVDWPVEKFLEEFRDYERGEPLRWSCGTTKKIVVGDRIFLAKSGSEGRGVIGSGTVVRSPYYASHFLERKEAEGEETLFVDIKFDYLAKPGTSLPIHRHELDAPNLKSAIWNVQGNGKTIPADVAAALEVLWRSRVPVGDFVSPDELGSAEDNFYEGAKKQITVNAYERNADARRRCLEKWGYNCAVCQFRFDLAYGSLGKGYIHVHHMVPLSSIGEKYEVDPVKDLRPVCPNCHAMLHRKTPPLSIEELQTIVSTYRR